MADYPKWRKDRCVSCAAGLPIYHIEERTHVDQKIGWSKEGRYPPCTAPKEADYIAELESAAALQAERIATLEAEIRDWRNHVMHETKPL
jgi:hypothetical protein